jgi:sugar phosphate isomerase/epimerase
MTENATEPGWILWSGTVGLESAIDKRIRAAVAGDFTRFTVSSLDVSRAEESGGSAAEIARQARDHGLQIVLDPVLNWHPCKESSTSRFGRFSRDDSLRMAEELEAVAITAVAMPSADVPIAELADPFAGLCDRAADIGAVVHLEFIPMTVVPDLLTAWQIVRDADRLNGGIVFDTWHFFRGVPDFDVLASVPGDRIFAVQIDDAAEHVRGTMSEDTRNRLLPGDGAFDLPRVVSALDAIGGLSWVGPEVISPELEAMSGEAAAVLAGERVRSLIAQNAATAVRSG